MKISLLLLFFASVLALASAYTIEYGLDLKPCHLCLLQRYPYMAAIGFSALGIWFIPRPSVAWSALWGGTLSIIIGGFIAWYHTAVEWGLVEGTSDCAVRSASGGSIEELRAAILNSPLVACDQPAFEFMGISMAAMNAVYSVA